MDEMSSKIDSAAGEILRYLSENGESSSMKIKTSLGISNTMLYLALGWLSRECKVNIASVGYSYNISLN